MALVPALQVRVPATEAEIVASVMWAQGVNAISEEASNDDLILLQSDLPAHGATELITALAKNGWEASIVEVDDGQDAWRDFAQVVRAGKNIVVWPPWVELGEVSPNDIVISLDPKDAWGHGAHPTTVACLAELERIMDEGRESATDSGYSPQSLVSTVLDLGCGSGALSVAAAMMGATQVYAIDIDPAALEATEANALANGVASRIMVGASTNEVPRVDVVVANIGVQTLIEMSSIIKEVLRPGGTLIISGILHPAPEVVTTAFQPLALRHERVIDKWVSLTLS